MKIIVLIIALIAIVVCSLWFAKAPGYDSGSAALAALITFVGAFFIPTKPSNIKMSQKAGDNSNQYQSGGPMNIK